jgi:hypothetical protein
LNYAVGLNMDVSEMRAPDEDLGKFPWGKPATELKMPSKDGSFPRR